MLRRFRMQLGNSSSWSCPEKQRRRRGEQQSWGERRELRQTITTCSWPESSRRSEHCTHLRTLTFQAVVSGCILGIGDEVVTHDVFICFSVCHSQEYLNKKLYTNKPTKDYFYQFNTSSRWPPHILHTLILRWQCANKMHWFFYSHSMWIESWLINTCCLSDTYTLILLADNDDKKGTRFLIQIVPRTLFFSHISSYSGRFIMQLQLYWTHMWYKSNQLLSPMIHIDTISPVVLIVHTKHHGEAHLHTSSGTPPLFPLTPPLPLRHCCCSLSAFLSSEEASLNKPIHIFNRFLSFNYKKGGKQQWKSKGQRPRLSPRHMKSKEWVAGEWVSVCVHSFLIQS